MRNPEKFKTMDEDLHHLASLDPAADSVKSDKREIFSRVVNGRVTADFGRRRSPITHPLRWIGGTVVAAALVALFVIAPFSQRGTISAFATWTAAPSALSPEMKTILDGYCDVTRPHAEETDTTGECEIIVKEQRGDLGFAAARTATGSLKTAIFLGSDSFLKSIGRTSVHPEALARDQVKMAWGASATRSHKMSENQDEELLLATTIIGAVGSDVVGVELAINPEVSDPGQSQIFPVKATVENGYFAAWWPGEEVTDDFETELVFNVTLASGEVLRNVPLLDH